MSDHPYWSKKLDAKRSSKIRETHLQMEMLEERATMAGDAFAISHVQTSEGIACTIVPALTSEVVSDASEISCESILAEEREHDAESGVLNELPEETQQELFPLDEPCLPPGATESAPPATEGSRPQEPCDEASMFPPTPSNPFDAQQQAGGQGPTIGQGQGPLQLPPAAIDLPKVVSVPTVVVTSVFVPFQEASACPSPLQLVDISEWSRNEQAAIAPSNLEGQNKWPMPESESIIVIDQSKPSFRERTSKATLDPQVASMPVLMPIVEPKPTNEQESKRFYKNVKASSQPQGATAERANSKVDDVSDVQPSKSDQQEQSAAIVDYASQSMPPAKPSEKRVHSLVFLALVGFFSFPPLQKRLQKLPRRRDIERSAKPLRVEAVEKNDSPRQ